MISALIVPQSLREFLAAEAARTYPLECCGLIEGLRSTNGVEAVALHPARNLATAPDRFEIDPVDQFRLMHALRDTEHEIVGCYHSHPNGVAAPSARDREGAGEDGFVWLIAGVQPNEEVRLAAFVFAEGSFRPLGLA